jgi:hypothetical protein
MAWLTRRMTLAISAAALCTAPAMAQEKIDFQAYRPTATAVKITPAEAPKIDGDLSDAIWARAKKIDDFYSVDPIVGAAPKFRTEAWILYDEDNLYVAFRAHDAEPDKVMRTSMKRDGDIWKDDAVRVTLDPQNTGRHGYTFEIGSGGARWDALVQNNNNTISEWNTIWAGSSGLDAQGWTAEFAIPFKSLSFDPNAKSWGFNMGRSIRRFNEPVRWSNVSNTYGYYDMSRSGRLEGVEGITQGLGLDVEVLGAANYKYEWENPRQGDLRFEPSANLYYKITPSLQGTVTVNTDFSDAPLDARQVNTGRFGLFIPETRDFFLQDASLFEFGGRGLSNSPNGRPFFTRNIGITNLGVADIRYGGKISGSVGSTNVAGLFVQTSGIDDHVAEKTLGAARIAQPIFGRSQVGAIFTFGDPSDDDDNMLGGVDLQIRDDSLLGGRELTADFYFERSKNNDTEDNAYGFEIGSYQDDWAFWANGKAIGEDFDPALGFVNRTGFKRINSGARYRLRPKDSDIGFYQIEAGQETLWTQDNHLESREMWLSAGMVTKIGDEFFMNLSSNRETIPFAFNLPDGVLVAADTYHNWNVGLYAGSSTARWINAGVNVDYGGLYGGDFFGLGLNAGVRPSPYLTFDLRHNFQEFRLPTGSLRIHISSMAANLNFTPDMTLTLQSEYDNISSGIGLSARYRWEFIPGNELFASVGHAAFVEGRDFRSQTTTAGVRVGSTFRF